MSEQPLLSVAIITFNEERNLARTLQALDGLADEIIIVDSFSTDATREIAEQNGAIVYSEEWKGHIAQKNSALEKCRGVWILSLDADEVLTPELYSEIKAHITTDSRNRASVNRRTVYCGSILRRAWQPDVKLRLVRRDSNPTWGGYNPHDVLFADGTPVKLRGELLHYSYRDVRDHWQKTIFYARATAESYAALGRKASALTIIANPIFSFLKNYLIRGWFVDGVPGLIAGASAAVYVFLKYTFLWEITRNQEQSAE